MIKLNRARRLRLFIWRNRRIVIISSAVVMAVLLYLNYFVLTSVDAIESTELSGLVPLFGITFGLFISLIILLLDE
jgi:hypothetical protein